MNIESVTVALRFTIVTLLLTGIAYPLAATGLAQLIFPARANGSLVSDGHGQTVGSELIGQSFHWPAYFWPRPSAAGAQGYDATASGGSNLSVTAKKLHQRIAAERARLEAANPGAGPPPDDLLTASASGLDPHISPAAARWQLARVARARGVAPGRVQQIVEANIEGRELGFLGEPRVNVLALNRALDQQFGQQLGPPFGPPSGQPSGPPSGPAPH